MKEPGHHIEGEQHTVRHQKLQVAPENVEARMICAAHQCKKWQAVVQIRVRLAGADVACRMASAYARLVLPHHLASTAPLQSYTR